ncbi:MAG: hypothetical protein AAF799_11095 [Myxococcota bacterium]
MNRSPARHLASGAVAFGLSLAASGSAQAEPLGLLVVEHDAGAVLRFGEGGDLSTAERFATGLSDPYGLCVGPGGDIYVAESATGEITVITEGGDFTDAMPFAFATFTPVDLWCTETQILVSTPIPPLPVIADITQGGDLLLSIELYATGLPAPIGMTRDGEGNLFSANGAGIFDVTTPGDFAMAEPFATGQSVLTMTWTGEALWGGHSALPAIYDLTPGGDLTMAEPVAVLPTVGAGHIDGLLTTLSGETYAVTGNEIYEVGAGGDLTMATPFATGLQTGERGFVGMLEHICSADADCSDGDACNGMEQCVDNRCLPPEQPLSCDDGDACTEDSCEASRGCMHETIANCCDEDFDCTVDELCDLEAMVCVPVGIITTGLDGTGDGDDSGTAGGLTTGGELPTGATDDAGAADAGDGGCSCHQPGGEGPVTLAWLLLVLGWRRRPAS